MKTIQKKLKSETGSSMFLAIVFFMFCFFVGGTVLAAATANGGRLAALKRDRSAYYMERNAAVVIQSQMVGGRADVKPQVTISQVLSQKMSATDPQKASDLRPTGSAWSTLTVTTTNCSTDLQKYICEAVVRAYLGMDGTVQYDGETKTVAQLAQTSGSLTVTIPGGENSQDKTITADYVSTCDFSKIDEFGNIVFTVKNGDKDGQFRVTVPAAVYKSTTKGARDAEYNAGTKLYTMIQDSTTTYTVTLDNAVIGKMLPVEEQEGMA